jgi:Skp family chaperone for outer membrane proteins
MTAAADRRGHTSSTAHKKKAHFSETHKDKKEKKYVTTNAIFKSKPDRIHKRAKASPKSKRSDLGKSRHRREPSSSPPPRTLADESNGMTGLTSASQLLANPLSEALDSYRSHVTDNSEQLIAHAYKDLVQQLDRTTLGPDALSTRIANAIEAAQNTFTPFADTSVSVVYKDNAGNITSEADVPIGSTFKRFEKKLQKTKDELEALWEEWEDVRRDIAETGAQILHDSKFPAQFGLEAVNSHLSPSSRTNPEVESVRKLIKRESEKARKELDQEAKDAINKHKEYQNMWRSWLQDELN